MSYLLRHAMTQKQLDHLYFMKRDLRRKQKNVTMQKSLNKGDQHAPNEKTNNKDRTSSNQH